MNLLQNRNKFTDTENRLVCGYQRKEGGGGK